MNYNKNELETKAREYGFNSETYEKQIRLVDILEEIDKDPTLRCTLALKGGTSINLFVMDGNRLSLDIDLDYTQDCSAEEMLKDRKIITEKIHGITQKYGYDIKGNSRSSHILDSIRLKYNNIHDRSDMIKMDINYIDRCHVLPIERQNIKAPWVESDVKIQCLNIIEIFASKMVALCTRAKARDLYDVANLKENLKLSEKDKEMLHKCIVFYSTIGATNIMESLTTNQMRTIKQYNIKTEILPVCRKKEFISVDGLYEKVEGFIKEMQKLSVDDEKYIDNFQRGHYRPDLLFNGDELENICNHPMALFKVQQYEKKFMEEIEKDNSKKREQGNDGPELGD